MKNIPIYFPPSFVFFLILLACFPDHVFKGLHRENCLKKSRNRLHRDVQRLPERRPNGEKTNEHEMVAYSKWSCVRVQLHNWKNAYSKITGYLIYIYVPWCWYIYLQPGDFVRANFGKYSSTMEHMVYIYIIYLNVYNIHICIE